MGAKKNSESVSKSDWIANEAETAALIDTVINMEKRMIALERGLEGVLRRLEESGQPDDAPGWYGRPE